MAQSKTEQPAVITDIAKCRGIGEAMARLACFDAASARLDAAVSSKQLTVLDREGVRQTKRSLFGFSLPAIGLFGRGNEKIEAPEFSEIDTVIKQVLPLGHDKYEFVLEDGAHWVTTDAMPFRPKAGVKIRIKKAAMGSFFVSVEGQRTVKGRRVG